MLSAFISAVVIACAQDRSPESLYQEAWYHEIAEGRAGEALETYQALAARADLPAPLRARALFRSGVCLRKLQKRDEAKAAFDRLLKDFGAVTNVAEAARREIAGETEEEASLRKKAEGLIARLGDKDGKARLEARNNLVSLGPRVAPYVLAALGGSDFVISQEAAHVLVALAGQDTSLAASILAAVRSGDDAVRRHIREGFRGPVSWPSLNAVLVGWLSDPSPRVRAVAVDALERQKSPTVANEIEKLLLDPEREVRLEVVGALANLQGLGGDWLKRASADRDPEVRERAARRASYLVEHGNDARLDVAVTLGLLDDDSRAVVDMAVKALELHSRKHLAKNERTVFPGGEAGARVIERIGRIASDPASESRKEALALLGSSRRSEARPWVERLLKDSDRSLAVKAVAALGDVGGREVAPALFDLLKDPELGETAWDVFAQKGWIAGELERLVEQLPAIQGVPSAAGSRVGAILQTARKSNRLDLILAAARHYDKLDPQGRHVVLDYLGLTGPRREWLPTVLKGLEDPDEGVRQIAIRRAAELGDPQVVPGLIQCLETPSVGVRSEAANVLQSVGDRRAVPALIARLAEEGVAPFANAALKRLADRTAVGPILEVLRRKDLKDPAQALDCLKVLASSEDAGAIGEALKSLAPHVRTGVLDVLGGLRSPAAVPSVKGELAADDPNVREAAVKALDAIGGDQVLDAIVEALGDSESKVRKAAAEAMENVEPARAQAHARAIPALIGVLEDLDWSTRSAALDALVKIGDRRIVPALVDAMKTGDSRPRPVTVQQATRPGRPGARPPRPGRELPSSNKPGRSMASRAKEALHRFADRSLVGPLLGILESPNPANEWLKPDYAVELLFPSARPEDAPAIARTIGKVPAEQRAALVGVLGSLRGADTVGLVRPYLADADESLRQAAARALGNSGDANAVPILVEALRSEDSADVQKAILKGLEAFARPEAIPAILEKLKGGKPKAREKTEGWVYTDGFVALGSLLHYPPAEALKALASVLEMDVAEGIKDDALRVLAQVDHPDAVPLLLRQLSSSGWTTRAYAVLALGSTYDARALPGLLELLKDPSEKVREHARTAIDKIRFDLETRRLAGGVAPGVTGATGELVRQLADESPAVRAAAAKSIGRIKAREALAALVRARKDADSAVRAAVEEALDAIALAEEAAR